MAVLGVALALAFLTGTERLQGQTLARKGWAGSGISVDPWWKNAVFYEVDPAEGLEGIVARLDELQSLGVDAIVLSRFAVEADGSGGPASEQAYGMEDFDRLGQEASRRKMRLVIELEQDGTQSAVSTMARARFWLSRGAGGLLVRFPQENGNAGTPDPAERVQRMWDLRRLCGRFAGDRVVIAQTGPLQVVSSLDPVVGAAGLRRRKGTRTVKAAGQVEQGAHLVIDRRFDEVRVWDAFALQAMLFGDPSATKAIVESDATDQESSWSRFSEGKDPGARVAVAKTVAAMLFLGREEPMLFSGQELGGDAGGARQEDLLGEEGDASSLLNWYRSLSRLRHERGALRGGLIEAVATGYPEVVAWVRRGAGNEPPVLVVCNVSSQARVVSVAEGLRGLRLSTANGVQVVAASDAAMPRTYSATGITLPAYGVYVAELRQPGLEDAAAPAASHHKRR